MQHKVTNIIHRSIHNPVLSAKDVPYNIDGLVFNAGVTKFNNQYLMVFRNDFGSIKRRELFPDKHGRANALGKAWSNDGINWVAEPEPMFNDPQNILYRAYDPRLTVIDGLLYMCFALTNKHGTHGGIAVSKDSVNWNVLSLTVPDNRNMVLFPERINGKLVRLERPFAKYLRSYPNDPFEIYMSMSPDGHYWGDTKCILGISDVPWVNDKIGPGSPPVKTEKGWLAFFHGVDFANGRNWGWENNWHKRYRAGLMLLDLENPSRVIGLSEGPLLIPEESYELYGYRDQVIFPGGMILEDNGIVKIYYGAADTVECLAEAKLEELLALCKSVELETAF